MVNVVKYQHIHQEVIERIMLFPESERVIYDKNPLQQVICQLRFPPILRINTEVPVAFQERVKQDYPFYQEKSEITLLTQVILNQLPKEATETILQEKSIVPSELISS